MTPHKSTARLTLEAARHFLQQAALCGVEDRQGFVYNINAAIVFGRSVTGHLQKEYAHQSGFDTWYPREQAALKDDAVCKFFDNSRTAIVHLELKGAKKIASVSITAGILPVGWLVVQPIRAQPWYRRSPKILWEDAWRSVRQPIDRLRLHLWLRIEAMKARWTSGKTVVTESLYFDDPAWDKIPVFDLVKRYVSPLSVELRKTSANPPA